MSSTHHMSSASIQVIKLLSSHISLSLLFVRRTGHELQVMEFNQRKRFLVDDDHDLLA